MVDGIGTGIGTGIQSRLNSFCEEADATVLQCCGKRPLSIILTPSIIA